MKIVLLLILLFIWLFPVFSQTDPFGTIKLNNFIDSLETIEYIQTNIDTTEQNINTYEIISKENIREKLKTLNSKSLISFPASDEILNTIFYYLTYRKKTISTLSGLSQLYYPIYEEIFNRQGIPLDLKHLSAVESAFIPYIQSPAGAKGLWQFMYGTGISYGLKVTDYVDERCDVYKSTEAAAMYLKYLFGLYKNWHLALAAYNCGPGNVNKAVSRAGGKFDFWAIRPYLPKETQEYIPRFITLSFLITYAQDFGIEPLKTKYFTQKDTVRVKVVLNLYDVSNRLKIDFNNLRYLNSQYTVGVINQGYSLMLPEDKVNSYITIYEGLQETENKKLNQIKENPKEKEKQEPLNNKQEENKQEFDPFGTIRLKEK